MVSANGLGIVCVLMREVVSLGQLVKIIRESQMEYVVDKLIDFSAGKDEELRDISGLGTSRTRTQ